MSFTEVEGIPQLNDGKPRRITSVKVQNCAQTLGCLPHKINARCIADGRYTSPPCACGNVIRKIPAWICCSQAHSFELQEPIRGEVAYTRGGLVTQVKEPKQLSFRSLADVRTLLLSLHSRGVVACIFFAEHL